VANFSAFFSHDHSRRTRPSVMTEQPDGAQRISPMSWLENQTQDPGEPGQ
jgi:hypothetical protein